MDLVNLTKQGFTLRFKNEKTDIGITLRKVVNEKIYQLESRLSYNYQSLDEKIESSVNYMAESLQKQIDNDKANS